MTSRVQKGGSIFKPAVKSRARSSAAPSGETSAPARKSGGDTQSSTSAPKSTTSQLSDTAVLSTHTSQSVTQIPIAEQGKPTPSQPTRRNAGPPSIKQAHNNISRPLSVARTVSSTPVSMPPSLRSDSIPTHSSGASGQPPDESAFTTTAKRIPYELQSMLASGSQDAFNGPPPTDASSVLPHPLSFPTILHPMLQTQSSSSLSAALDPSFLTFSAEYDLDPQLQDVSTQHHILHDSMSGNLVPHLLPPSGYATLPEQPEASTSKSTSRPRRSSWKVAENAPSQDTVGEAEEGEAVLLAKKRGRSRRQENGEKKKTKRRRKASSLETDGEQSADDEDPAPAKKQRKRTFSATPRSRKKRAPSLPAYDPNADPGEEIDPTVVTMANLCEDTGYGRISSKASEIQSNHAAWKALNRQKRVSMRARMERKKYGMQESDEEAPPAPAVEDRQPAASNDTLADKEGTPVASATSLNADPAFVDETGNDFDYAQSLTTSRFNVQVRIGPNGETIIDEESLIVDRHENQTTENYTQITESDATKFTNSGTYGRRFRGSRWSAEETELFYEALAQYGENYELISYVLPGRDRKACKNKFKAEDKKNGARITFVLNNAKPMDIDTLSRMTGKDFSGPVPEIAVPPPPIIVPEQNGESAGEKGTSSRPTTPGPARKRSQSRKASLAEGVEIMGTVDDYVDVDDTEEKWELTL